MENKEDNLEANNINNANQNMVRSNINNNNTSGKKLLSFEMILNDISSNLNNNPNNMISNLKANANNNNYFQTNNNLLLNNNDQDDEENNEDSDPFKVYIRTKPLLEKEREILTPSDINLIYDYCNVVNNNTEIKIIDPLTIDNAITRKTKSFTFDGIFRENHDNEYIFNTIIKKLVEKALRGINSTIMAYGVTGTGKTHTMFGDIYNEINFEKGICMYSIDYLFKKVEQLKENNEVKVKVSYLELYNEQVIDLLIPNSCSLNAKSNTNQDFCLGSTPLFKKDYETLMIVEDPNKGVVVPGLTEFEVKDTEDILSLLLQGNMKRTMAATGSNQFSSRSHAILQILIEQKTKGNNIDEIISSKFLIVDLAGSERGGAEKGIRTQEGSNINRSLLALGNCINLLSDKRKSGSFVPYRDSRLTRLLKESLGGNISTVMISCISMLPSMYDETVNTLKYASRARKIEKKVLKNVREVELHISQYKEIIESLKQEITQLKRIIKNNNVGFNYYHQKNFKQLNSFNYLQQPNNKELETLNNGNKININNKHEMENKTQIEINNHNTSSNNLHLTNIDSNNKELNMTPTKTSKENNNYYYKQFFSNQNNNKEATEDMIIQNSFLSKLASESYIEKNYIEEILNINFNELTNISEVSREIEQKLNSINNYKQHLDNLMCNIGSTNESTLKADQVQEKYQYIGDFYEKLCENLNDQLIENLEKNLNLKCNLKEINELNNTNSRKIEEIKEKVSCLTEFKREKEEKYKESNENNEENNNNNNKESNNDLTKEIVSLEDELNNLTQTMKENNTVLENVKEILQKNELTKNFLKATIQKINSSSEQMKGKNLQLAFLQLQGQKRELEIKNKFYKENISSLNKKLESSKDSNSCLMKKIEDQKTEIQNKDFTILKLYQRLKEQEEISNELRENVRKISSRISSNINKKEIEDIENKYSNDLKVKDSLLNEFKDNEIKQALNDNLFNYSNYNVQNPQQESKLRSHSNNMHFNNNINIYSNNTNPNAGVNENANANNNPYINSNNINLYIDLHSEIIKNNPRTNNTNNTNITNNINNAIAYTNKPTNSALNNFNSNNLLFKRPSLINSVNPDRTMNKHFTYNSNTRSTNNFSFNYNKNLSKNKKLTKHKDSNSINGLSNNIIIREDDNISLSAVTNNTNNNDTYLNSSELDLMNKMFNHSQNNNNIFSNNDIFFSPYSNKVKTNSINTNLNKVNKTTKDKEKNLYKSISKTHITPYQSNLNNNINSNNNKNNDIVPSNNKKLLKNNANLNISSINNINNASILKDQQSSTNLPQNPSSSLKKIALTKKSTKNTLINLNDLSPAKDTKEKI